MSDYIHDNTDNHPDNNISHLPAETPDDGTSFDVAAQRTKSSVKPEGGRKISAATYGAEIPAWGALVMGGVAKEVVSKAYKKATE